MEDAAVKDMEVEVSGAAEFAPALVAAHPFGQSVAVARPPCASCPLCKFTAEEKEKKEEEAGSSSSTGKAPMPDAPPEDPVPAPTQAAKKKEKKPKTKTVKVVMSQTHLDALMTTAKWGTLARVDEEWLSAMTRVIPNGEQFFADRGFSLEKYRVADDMDLVVKAQTEVVAELQRRQREDGYVEMEVTDDEDDEGGRSRAPYGRGRKRFRPGVCKKPGGEIRKLY
jgi:adenine-specific DNA glycosylase